MITYRATLDVADELALYLSGLLAAERRRRNTPRGKRALTPFKQAVLGLRWFLDRTPIPKLARDNNVGRATGYRYVDEVIEVLAAEVPDLHEALEDAAGRGAAYVMVDGKLFSTDRLGEATVNKKGAVVDRWFSGKHHTQGGNVLMVTDPTGFPLWTSEVEPGGVHDITSAQEHVLGALYWAYSELDLPTLGDGGFQGSGIGVFTPIKHSKSAPKGCPLEVDNKTYNALLTGLRALCERGFALLTQRWRTLQHITASPRKITAIVQAALTLTHHEHKRIH